ncbi:MAG: cytochrome P450 [Xenococcaceae cyanobacterium]
MKLPDGPKNSSLLRTIKWIKDPVGYMEASKKKYGDIFTLKFSSSQESVIMVSHPEAIKKILTSDRLSAPGYTNKILRPLLGNNSLFLLDEESHQRQRKLLMPPFHGERMFQYGQLIDDITKKVTSKWVTNKPFPIRETMKEITMSVILQAVFGLYEGEIFQQIKKLISERLEMTSTPWGATLILIPSLQKDWGTWSPWGRIAHKVRQIDELLYAEISNRREQLDPSRTDILSLLLLARDEEGRGLTDVELRDELMTLLVAGHETTATALAWAFYWIHKLPEVNQKLLDELDSLGANPDPMAIFRLPYLTAVCHETLRIYPVAMTTFPRVVNSTIEIMGYQLEPGTEVIGSIYLTHQREDLYPEPKQFKPERFLHGQFSPYEYLPFGGGSRRCLGIALAQFEMKLVLATILSRTQLALADSRSIEPRRRGILLAPAGGVKMVFQGQRQCQDLPVESVAS